MNGEQVLYAASWLINANAPPVAGGALLVRDGRIAAVGPLQQLRRESAAPVQEFPGSVILPGFVNAHTHLELSHFPSWRLHSTLDYAPGRFTDWIIQLIKILRGLGPDAYPASIHEGARMCLESGTTAVGEIVTNPAHGPLYRETPLAGRLYFELLGQEPGHFQGRLAAALAAAQTEGIPSPLVTGLSPHAPYTIAEEHLSAISSAASTHAMPLSIHLSESAAETDLLRDGSGLFAEEFYPYVGWERFLGRSPGCSPTELLDRYGLLSPSTLAVHCVNLTGSDAAIIKSRGTHIALCPRSNELLDVGTAPAGLFKKLGIPLALGTDSLASNNSLSLWDELRFALERYSGELDEHDLLRMVTAGGAEALGIASRCGTLEVGKRADFQVVDAGDVDGSKLVERVMREGCVQDVYAGGVRYTGGI